MPDKERGPIQAAVDPAAPFSALLSNRMLEPMDRISEILFGLIMALTFTCTLGVVTAGEPAIRTIAMPADTNPQGDIFGGWLLCQMDLADGTVATRRAGGRVVTIAITAMVFHRPVCIGDEVSCYASVSKTGDTSITIKIESWARRSKRSPTTRQLVGPTSRHTY